MPPVSRTPITLSLDPALVDEARQAGVNVSRAAEAGLRAALEGALAWRRENAESIASANAWVEEHGLPLEKYRMF